MRARKIIAFIIVAAGLGTAAFITGRGVSYEPSPVSVAFGEQKTEPSLQFESTRTQGGLFGNLQNEGSIGNTDNLTDTVVQKYLGNFLNNNLSAPAGGFSEEAIQEQIARGLSSKTFGLEDIRISNDNSVESQIAYMESVDSLLRKNFPGFNRNITDIVEEFTQNGDSDSLEYLTIRIPEYIDGLLDLKVPSLWQVYHLQLVNLWQKKLTAYRAILDVKNDPLKTYIAIQEIPNIINEDLTLQAILIERYQELKA